jgi:hypothetical protein
VNAKGHAIQEAAEQRQPEASIGKASFVVHAHKSEAEFDVSVACAAIPTAR